MNTRTSAGRLWRRAALGLLLTAPVQLFGAGAEEDEGVPDSGRTTPAQEAPLPQWAPVDSILYSKGSPLEAGLGGGLWPQDYYPLPREPDASSVDWAVGILQEKQDEFRKDAETPHIIVLPKKALPPAEETAPPETAADQPEPVTTLTTADADLRVTPVDASPVADRAGALADDRLGIVSRFLEFHAQDSGIPIALALLKSNERLPQAYDLRAAAKEWFGNEMGCLVVYTMGDPRRAEVILSERARQAEGESREGVLSSQAISDALAVTAQADQLDRFLAQISVRLFWLEKTMKPTDGADAVVSAAIIPAPTHRRDWIQPLILSLAGVGALAFGLFLLKLRRRKRSARVWMFPDRPCAERFGGRHAGGGHVVVSFEPGQAVRARRLLPRTMSLTTKDSAHE